MSKRHKSALIRRSVLVIAVAEPAMTIPQIWQIWINNKTEGISLATWSMYISAAVVWLLYGLQLKDKPLMISSTLWIITELAVVVGVIVH